jgi:hypothetical protein
LNFIIENALVISKGSYWTSGSDFECPNKYFWCSKESEIIGAEVSWKSGQPASKAGDCVYAEIGNGTVLATGDCGTELHFVCEIRKKGTEFQGLTFECMELWDVSEGFNFKFYYLFLTVS